MHFSHTITITARRPSLDRYGDRTWSDPWLIEDVVVAPVSMASITDDPGRLGDTSRWTLLLSPDANLEANDEVIIGDETWTVDGNPGAWCSPFTGWTPGKAAEITRGEG